MSPSRPTWFSPYRKPPAHLPTAALHFGPGETIVTTLLQDSSALSARVVVWRSPTAEPVVNIHPESCGSLVVAAADNGLLVLLDAQRTPALWQIIEATGILRGPIDVRASTGIQDARIHRVSRAGYLLGEVAQKPAWFGSLKSRPSLLPTPEGKPGVVFIGNDRGAFAGAAGEAPDDVVVGWKDGRYHELRTLVSGLDGAKIASVDGLADDGRLLCRVSQDGAADRWLVIPLP